MAVGVQKAWSVTASSNGNSDTNANWAEGMLAPSINNSARANMAAIKGWSNQISGGCTCAGSSNAYTITSDAAAAISSAYGAGMMFMLKANHTNTGAATLNVDSVGAVAIKTSDGGDVVAGDIVSGGLYLLAYNATGPRFDLIGTFAGGAFQPLDATLTAVAGLSFSTTNAFFRATDVDTFVAESASNFRSALGLGNLATVTPGTGVAAALAVNVGSAGAIVVNGGVLGTPSSGTLTNATGLPISSGVSGLGTNVATALGIAIGSAGAVVTSNSTDTLSNKTLSSPTLSGTVAGAPTVNGAWTFSGNLQTITRSAEADEGLRISNSTTSRRTHFRPGDISSENGNLDLDAADGNNVNLQTSGTTRLEIGTSLLRATVPLQSAVAISSETSGTLTSASSNKQVNASGDITINDGVHAAGDRIEIYAGASARSIVQDTGMTLRLDGSSTTGTRSLAARGRAALYFVSNSEAIVSGMGVT